MFLTVPTVSNIPAFFVTDVEADPRSTRNCRFGGSKLRSPYRMSLPAALCLQGSKIPSHRRWRNSLVALVLA